MLTARVLKKEDVPHLKLIYDERGLKFVRGAKAHRALWTHFLRGFTSETTWTLVVTDKASGDEPLGVAYVQREWLPEDSGKIQARVLDFYVLKAHRPSGEKVLARACLRTAVAIKAERMLVEPGAAMVDEWAVLNCTPDLSPRLTKGATWDGIMEERAKGPEGYDTLYGIDPRYYTLDAEMSLSETDGSTSTDDQDQPSMSSAISET